MLKKKGIPTSLLYVSDYIHSAAHGVLTMCPHLRMIHKNLADIKLSQTCDRFAPNSRYLEHLTASYRI